MPRFRPRHVPLRPRLGSIVVPAAPECYIPNINLTDYEEVSAPPAAPKFYKIADPFPKQKIFYNDTTTYLPPITDGMIPKRSRFSAEDIGPVNAMELPQSIQDEAVPKVPDIQQPVMPYDFYEEARYGIKVPPQDPDYIPPPVENVIDPAGFTSPDVSDETLVRMITEGVVKLGDKDIKDFNISSADFGSELNGPNGERLNLLDGVSRFQRFGSSSGRVVQ